MKWFDAGIKKMSVPSFGNFIKLIKVNVQGHQSHRGAELPPAQSPPSLHWHIKEQCTGTQSVLNGQSLLLMCINTTLSNPVKTCQNQLHRASQGAVWNLKA